MLRVAPFLFLALLLTGCGSGGKIVAVVNGQVITAGDIETRLNRMKPALRAKLAEDPSRLVDEMVTETLLLQEAKRRGLSRDPEVQGLLEETRRQILIGRLLEIVRESGEEAAPVSEEEAAAFYRKNKERFAEPESWRASHILVDTEEEAKSASVRISGGEKFADVAEQVSDDPSKTRGGDIGFFSKGQIIPEFEKAVEKLKPGEISPIVKSSIGYHLILLTDRRPARQLGFEEVKEKIQRQLAAQQQRNKVETFVRDLRSKSSVQVRQPSASAALRPEETIPAVPAPGSVPSAESSNP